MVGWIVSYFFSFYISDVVSEEIGQKKLRQTVTVLRVIYHVMTLSTMACCSLVPKHNKMAKLSINSLLNILFLMKTDAII